MNGETKSFEQIQALLNKAPCGIGLFTIDDGKPIFLNAAYYDLVGYTKEEYADIVETQVSTLMLPQDLSTSQQSQKEFKQHGEAAGYEYRIVRKDGQILWIKFEVSTIMLEGECYAFCSFSDITKEHDTATKLNLIADNSNESISMFRVGNDGERLLFANDRFYEMMGITREQYESDGPGFDQMVVSERDKKRMKAAYETCIKTGQPGELDYQLHQPSGKTIWARRRFVAVKQDDGDAFLFISIVSDITDKKEREFLTALEHSRYELVVDELGAAVFEWNMVTGEFYASKAYSNYAISQVDPIAIFNNSGPMDLVHPEDRDRLQQFFNETDSGKEKVTVTLRMKMTAGGYHWCKMTALFYNDDQGNRIRTIGVLTDVNEEYEKAFMIDTLINEMPGGVAILRAEPELKCEYFSDGFAKLSGRTREEVQALIDSGLLFEDSIAASDYDRFVLEVKRAYYDKSDINITYRYIKKGGQIGWLHLTANMMRHEGVHPIYYCVFTIPTEESLLYRSLVKESSTGVFVGERKERRILYMNDFCLKITGGKYRHDINEYSIAEFLPENRRPLFSQEDIDSLSEDHYCEFHVERSDYYLVVKAKAITWNGIDAYVAYISDDTNEHKQWLTLQHQAELEQTAEKAIRDTHAKSEFLSRMSHDMRTPMNGILGLAELSEDENDIDVIKENMAKIKDSGKYLLGLINDTLDYQRIETGRMTLDLQIVETQTLMDSILSIINPAAENKGVKFSVVNHNVDINNKLRIDPMRCKEIIINLLSNAIKFTPAGGTVQMAIRCLSQEDMMGHYEIKISDTGIGMSQDFLANHIFKAFSQETNAVSTVYAGSGLGLSIAKSLVELMGGSITVESEVGEGTTFTILLDLERIASDAAQKVSRADHESVEEAKQAIEGKHILLAEDHPLNAEIATRLLEKTGCHISWVKNGQKCVDTFANSEPGQFDVILMDIRMPIMNGLEATTVIRSMARKDAKTIPILAMTANAYSEDIQHSHDVGMNVHLSKPIVPAVLYQEIAKVLKTD